MISAAAMCRAASAAKRIISTAPIAKLGATKQLALDASAAACVGADEDRFRAALAPVSEALVAA